MTTIQRVELWTPPDLFTVQEQRRMRLEACNADVDLQEVAMEACRDDVALWLQDWVWTFDPRLPDAILPFTPFPRQLEYLDWRADRKENNQRGQVEKSRDMGVTWLNVADQVHDWLWHDGHVGGFGSRKEAYVDNGDDPKSIFAKIRFLVAWLPKWMRPVGFDWRRHSAKMRLINPANGNSLIGEAGSDIGRGGRSRVFDLDEAAHIEAPNDVEAALSANANIIIETSTPRGGGNPFARRCRGGVIPLFSFHWRQDPRKDDAWYAKQVAELDPIVVAQEIDIDYDASISGQVVPMALVRPCVGRVAYKNERGALCVGVDIAEEGRDKSAHVVREGRNLSDLAEWHGADPVASTNILIALGLKLEVTRLQPGHRLYFQVDKIGIGSGVVAGLREYVRTRLAKPLEPGQLPWNPWVIVGVIASESAPDTSPACDKRKDWLWWQCREWVRTEAPSMPDGKLGEQLARELSSPTYGINNSGAIVIESKTKMKSRGVVSPNLADALIHSFHMEPKKPLPPTAPKWASTVATGSRIG